MCRDIALSTVKFREFKLLTSFFFVAVIIIIIISLSLSLSLSLQREAKSHWLFFLTTVLPYLCPFPVFVKLAVIWLNHLDLSTNGAPSFKFSIYWPFVQYFNTQTHVILFSSNSVAKLHALFSCCPPTVK